MHYSLYDDEQFSDITIKFERYNEHANAVVPCEVKCHRVILSHTSKYFNSMCGPMKKLDKDQEVIIILDNEDADGAINEAVLRHIYNFPYPEIQRLCDLHGAEAHMDVFIAARKYLLPKLERRALVGLDKSIKFNTSQCTTDRNVNRIFSIVKLLMNNKQHNIEFEANAKQLIFNASPSTVQEAEVPS
jgi:hypothetical protein